MTGALTNGLLMWDERLQGHSVVSVINEFCQIFMNRLSFCVVDPFLGKRKVLLMYLRMITLAKYLDVKCRAPRSSVV